VKEAGTDKEHQADFGIDNAFNRHFTGMLLLIIGVAAFSINSLRASKAVSPKSLFDNKMP
jgi:hypothetical protein